MTLLFLLELKHVPSMVALFASVLWVEDDLLFTLSRIATLSFAWI